MKQSEIFSTKKIRNPTVQLTNATNLAIVDIYTATEDDAIVRTLSLVSDDTSARLVNLYLYNGTAYVPMGTFNIAAMQGLNGSTVAFDLLSSSVFPGFSYDQNGKRIFPLEGGFKIAISVTSQLTEGKTMSLVGIVEEY